MVNVENTASRTKFTAWIVRWEAERRKRPPHAALRSIGKPVSAELPAPFGHDSPFSVEHLSGDSCTEIAIDCGV